jgi:DNA-binding MarR family transcriptional regulator
MFSEDSIIFFQGKPMHKLEDSLGFQVNRTANAMKSRFNNFLKSYNLTSEQYVIMKSVQENQDITPTQLSEITLKDKTTITRMIDTLVKNEMLIRTPKPNDRRAYQISWSKKGEKVMDEILPITGDIIKKLSSQFDKKDLKTFFKMLETLRQTPCLESL